MGVFFADGFDLATTFFAGARFAGFAFVFPTRET
jgi:hypothetical protein